MGGDTINSVKVLSIHEEKLKFRVILTFEGAIANRKGRLKFNLPVPTSIANSHEYSASVIKIDSFTAQPPIGTNNATWALEVGAGQAIKQSAILIKMNIGGSQSVHNRQYLAAEVDTGRNEIGGFQQLLPLQVVNVGNGAGTQAAADGGAWTAIGSGVAATDPLMCGNPFGQSIDIKLLSAVADMFPCYVASAGALVNDIGQYTMSMTIELIPNAGGC